MRIDIDVGFRIKYDIIDDFAIGPKYWIFTIRGRDVAYTMFLRIGHILISRSERNSCFRTTIFERGHYDGRRKERKRNEV